MLALLFATLVNATAPSGTIPSYPHARPVIPPVVALQPDGSRLVTEQLATPDSVEQVRDFYLRRVGPQALASDRTGDGRRLVLFGGPTPGAPQVSIWRDEGQPETRLLVQRIIRRTEPLPTETQALAAPAPASSIYGVPLPPGAVRDETERVSGGREMPTERDVASFSTSRPFSEVAAFYRVHFPGAATESHDGGMDWLSIVGKGATASSVQVVHDPGSPTVRIVVYRRAMKSPTVE